MDPALGGLEVLRRVAVSGVDPLTLLENYDAVRARIRVEGGRQSIEAPADGSPVNLEAEAGDSVIVEFGAGTFTIDRRSREWMNVRQGIRSLEIRGAGMDRTILTGSLRNIFSVWQDAAFENLVVRDLTLGAGAEEGTLLDVQGRVSAAMENVRISGWSSGGYSGAIGVSGSAIFCARGCEFLGGADGGLFVLSVRGLALAVFEKCLFADVEEAVVGTDGRASGSAVRLIDCTYENSAVVSRRMESGKGKTAFAVAVRGGKVALGPTDLTDEKRRTLWGAPFLASLDGVVFGPGKPPCTLEELLAVLDRVLVDPTEVVFGVRYLGPGGTGPARFGVRLLDRSSSAVVWRVVGADGTNLERSPRNPGGGWNPPKAAALESTGLAAAIRTSEVPLSAAASEAALTGGGSDDGATPHLYVRPSMIGSPMWIVDVSTGKVLSAGTVGK